MTGILTVIATITLICTIFLLLVALFALILDPIEQVALLHPKE